MSEPAGIHEEGTRGPLYRRFARQIAAAIEAGWLEPGLVLLEGPLAALLGTSRATVGKALASLSEQGAIRRFEGRGYMVRPRRNVAAVRRALRPSDLGLAQAATLELRPTADRIIGEVESALRVAIAFGHYRVLEQPLADAFEVSRPIVREVLWRLRDKRLVEKDHHSHWLAGPLTARAVAEDYELRLLIEPYALARSAPQMATAELLAMRGRIDGVLSGRLPADAELLGQIEDDLHVHCLRYYDNERAWAVLHYGHLPLLVNKLFAQFIGTHQDDPTFEEHRVVVEHLVRGAVEAAAASLSAHLRFAARRTMDRLKVLSVIPEPELPGYLERII